LRHQNLAVATTFTPRVRTSGRTPGRAEHGLGALLARLEDVSGSHRPHATHSANDHLTNKNPVAALPATGD